MQEFEYKNLLELKKMQLNELELYYMQMRKYEYDNHIPLKNIKIRKEIHNILLTLVKIDRILSKEELYVIGDKRFKNRNVPKIYACTHIGGNDAQRTFEAIEEHAYLFIADLKGLYKDLTGKMLFLNGAICFETENEDDRHIAYERALEVLSSNTNLLIYPEGCWNLTENYLTLPLYNGTVKMAYETGADIIPVAIEQYDNKFFVNIGKNIRWQSKYSNQITNMNELLRSKLATLKYEIFESRGIVSRNIITDSKSENFVESIIGRCPYPFTKEDAYNTMYRNETAPFIAEQLKIDEEFIRFRRKRPY